jgi:hypothetical protein
MYEVKTILEDGREWIRQEILSHMERHRIMAHSEIVDEMVAAAAKGCYAFNIIYIDIGDPDYDCILSKFSELDHSQIRVRFATKDTSLVFSYDGGNRFQWFDKETIYIDPAKVREIKINQIIGI